MPGGFIFSKKALHQLHCKEWMTVRFAGL